jgi:hypothetical protein
MTLVWYTWTICGHELNQLPWIRYFCEYFIFDTWLLLFSINMTMWAVRLHQQHSCFIQFDLSISVQFFVILFVKENLFIPALRAL